jgi:hypothetical protein
VKYWFAPARVVPITFRLFFGKPVDVALKQALPSESDKCVKPFIQASIKTLDNEQKKLQDNGEWLPAFLCN